MNNFWDYFTLGYEHIVSYAALDHLLFLLALIAVYHIKSWLRYLIAISFFTIGHSLTLALGAFRWVKIDSGLIEFLIPITIVVTALYNITKGGQQQRGRSRYWLAGIFGLIHGLGFSNYYQMLVMGDSNGWQAMLPFNLGVEAGQLVVAVVLLVLLFIYQTILNKKVRDWNLFISGLTFGLSLWMAIEKWPFG